MKALRLALAIAVAAMALRPVRGLAAQDVAARLDGRVPAQVVHAVQGISQDAAARGLPVEPLIQKAIEGAAKGVPAEGVIAAVRLVAARLDEARAALRDGGIVAPRPEAIEGGADALNAGLNASQVRDLGRASRLHYDPTLTLQVAATLTALGVPAQQGLELMTHMIQAGRDPSELLDLPDELQAGMARGATAGQAAEELEAAHGHEGPQGPRGHPRPHDEHDQHEQPGRPPRKP